MGCRAFALAFAAAVIVAPGLALADMSCREFAGMDNDTQMQIVGSMESSGEMSAGGSVAAGGDDAEVVANDDLVAAVQAVCADEPDKMLGDAVTDASTNE